MIPFDQVLKFVELLNSFQAVKRTLLVKGQDRDENDVEHSYTLAMLAWYVAETNNLKLDITKIIKYSLVHDMVEVYAGDVYFYGQDERSRIEKKQKEERAAERLRAEFKDFQEMHNLITAYERQEDEESKFVYAFDKLEPVIKIYLDGGRSWKRSGITLQMARENKVPKIERNKTAAFYLEELLKILEKDEATLFPKEIKTK